jgi:hypothetical protein
VGLAFCFHASPSSFFLEPDGGGQLFRDLFPALANCPVNLLPSSRDVSPRPLIDLNSLHLLEETRPASTWFGMADRLSQHDRHSARGEPDWFVQDQAAIGLDRTFDHPFREGHVRPLASFAAFIPSI